MAGVYLHIPFCKQACSYCDFYFSTQLASKGLVIKALASEIDARHSYLHERHLQSIYFGGGTPSLLSESELLMIFEALGRHFTWDKETEITLEANPDDIRPDVLKTWIRAGVNRLSIGLQSFDDEELKWMNRAHTASESLHSVKHAQDAGFKNITIDLIYGSKFQSLQSWEKTLDTAIGLNTQHISSYNLTIEHKTVLGLKHARGQEPPVNDTLSSNQFLMMTERLAGAGFQHYEISNFGKPGFWARHNSNYWLQKHYLGIGPSAHSFNGTSRQWNVKNNSQYMKALNEGTSFFEKEELSLHDRYNEYILTRLRTAWGCDASEMETLFGPAVVAHFKAGVAEKSQHFDAHNGIYTLTGDARLLADGIASDLFMD